MKNRPSIRELFDAFETEIGLVIEKTKNDENMGKIKALSLVLEERVNELYRRLEWKRKPEEKPKVIESGTESCVCGQPWVYEEAGLCATFGRCRDEYCFVNVKRQA